MNGPADKTDLPSALNVRLPTGIGREKLEKRFWAKVDKDGPIWNNSPCWLWEGARNSTGYSEFGVNGHILLAHRVAYELLKNHIPSGLILDHLCRNRICVNPAHLEPTTNRINILRGTGMSARHAKKMHCVNGHPFDMFNTYFRPGKGRECRECMKQRRVKRRLLV